CGLRYKGRTDLMLAEFAPGTTVAGVFTKSKTASATITKCKENLMGGVARALIVNSGNANAFTGIAGVRAVENITAAVGDVVGCDGAHVFSASTGVIGEPMDDGKITSALGDLKNTLGGGSSAWEAAASAIMTTDTFAKGATATAKIGDTVVTINGIAKGSGMIAPDMATMLSFIFTDAAIDAKDLQQMLAELNEKSFNSITVDSDTSTSDTVLAFATGSAKNDKSAELDGFKNALGEIMTDLAHQIVRDGEGASKFISINVTGAESEMAAKRIGLSIANSPLVKTAIAGSDANWGRIVMAVGKSGEEADRDKLSISIGGVEIAAMGAAAPGYDETPVAAHMKNDEINIQVDIGIGNGCWTVWT
ncbi:MAG: bifunctional glutamate N-acetyltransferase/amino-acid acetyltransferase ArgJ, partial [Rhodospirillaceae bacterium]|nr:bifunctional glutamate N-acetyltransferase/amino-acid acetyltransferase ArgJ [Rhodospirillaceae bacterium]